MTTTEFSPASMRRHKRHMANRSICCNKVANIAKKAMEFFWPSSEFNAKMLEIWGDYSYKSLTRADQAYVNSRIDYFREVIDREKTDFAYWFEHLGRYVVLRSEEYKLLAPKFVYIPGFDASTLGAIVWKDSPQSVYFKSSGRSG